MWVGLGVALTWQLIGQPGDISPVFIGLPASALTLFAVMLFEAGPAQAKLD
ncbi:MAG: hypothetical protein HWE39_09730 [Oceanospirillaceae bacterium]|nr:hypothetical protein [Oceanospirillaceae bacterium]